MILVTTIKNSNSNINNRNNNKDSNRNNTGYQNIDSGCLSSISHSIRSSISSASLITRVQNDVK